MTEAWNLDLDELQELAEEQLLRRQLDDELPSSLLSNIKDGDFLNHTTFPEQRWVVPAVLPEGFTLLVGAPKLGKSWLAYATALAVAGGGHALGSLPVGPPRPVLYLALEDGHARMQRRGQQLLGPDERFPRLLQYLLTIEPGAVLDTVAEWLDLPHVRECSRPPVVMLDTLGRVMPDARRGESTYQRDYRIAGGLHKLCELRPGLGVVALHHDRKAHADDFVDTVSGTNGIAGAADTIVVLSRQRMAATGLLKITGRDVDENEYALTFDEGRWALSGSLSEASELARSMRANEGLDQRSADVVALVQRLGSCDAADVERELGIAAKTATTYLARLCGTDRIQRLTRGVYGPC